MKNKINTLIILLVCSLGSRAQVGIGTSNPNTNAVLDINSTTKGILFPRMTTAQRNAISNPAEGLTIFNIDSNTLQTNISNNSNVYWSNCGFSASTNGAVYPSGTEHCFTGGAAIVDVINATTGKTWMDRNLGASQVANSITDANSYGDLYQWGRFTDRHQCRSSSTTTNMSTTDLPGHGDFITSNGSDWRSTENVSLWQGVNGINNPCPSGYRIPTEAELNAELISWVSNNADGAFGSVLKLPMAGTRFYSNGSLGGIGTSGRYWSSTVSGTRSLDLNFNTSNVYISDTDRSYGRSIRCIKD